MMAEKLSAKGSEWMAYHLIGKVTHKQLECSTIAYLRLSLCKYTKNEDALKRICEYTGVKIDMLHDLIYKE